MSRQAAGLQPVGRAALIGLLAVIGLFIAGCGVVPSPASVVAEPVRATTAAGDRDFVMTSQWKTFRTRGVSSGTSYSRLFVDVWGFNPGDAKPVWRTRIADDKRGENLGRKLLGVQ